MTLRLPKELWKKLSVEAMDQECAKSQLILRFIYMGLSDADEHKREIGKMNSAAK